MARGRGGISAPGDPNAEATAPVLKDLTHYGHREILRDRNRLQQRGPGLSAAVVNRLMALYLDDQVRSRSEATAQVNKVLTDADGLPSAGG